jgi:hypothetical protein
MVIFLRMDSELDGYAPVFYWKILTTVSQDIIVDILPVVDQALGGPGLCKTFVDLAKKCFPKTYRSAVNSPLEQQRLPITTFV